jgi:hypothetical protein
MHQIGHKTNNNNKHNCYVEFVPNVDERFHVVAKLDANPGEEITPD